MNRAKLKAAEALFLTRYPGGFAHEDMQAIGKKHNVARAVDYARTALARDRFANTGAVLDDIVRIVARSSMVSVFEKPKFRDFVNGLGRDDRAYLASGFKNLLHGKQAAGFEAVVDVLDSGRLAKWSLVTICGLYYRPDREVFVKPTTTKNVIRQFELDGLVYHPHPTWAFYADYRAAIEDMKAAVEPCLYPNNAAFTGFLMMSTGVER